MQTFLRCVSTPTWMTVWTATRFIPAECLSVHRQWCYTSDHHLVMLLHMKIVLGRKAPQRTLWVGAVVQVNCNEDKQNITDDPQKRVINLSSRPFLLVFTEIKNWRKSGEGLGWNISWYRIRVDVGSHVIFQPRPPLFSYAQAGKDWNQVYVNS